MFDVGFTEVVLIGVVSLLVIGPERLPAVARTAGLWIGKLQRFVTGVKKDLASELQTGDLKKLIGDQREQIDELREMVSSAKKDIQSTAQGVVASTREGLQELESSVKETREEVAKIGKDEPGQATDSSTGSDRFICESELDSGVDDVVSTPTTLAKTGSHPSVKTSDDTLDDSRGGAPDNDQSTLESAVSLKKRGGTTDTDNS